MHLEFKNLWIKTIPLNICILNRGLPFMEKRSIVFFSKTKSPWWQKPHNTLIFCWNIRTWSLRLIRDSFRHWLCLTLLYLQLLLNSSRLVPGTNILNIQIYMFEISKARSYTSPSQCQSCVTRGELLKQKFPIKTLTKDPLRKKGFTKAAKKTLITSQLHFPLRNHFTCFFEWKRYAF